MQKCLKKKGVYSHKTKGICSICLALPLSMLQPAGMRGSRKATFAARLQKLLLGVTRELWPGMTGGEQTILKQLRWKERIFLQIGILQPCQGRPGYCSTHPSIIFTPPALPLALAILHCDLHTSRAAREVKTDVWFGAGFSFCSIFFSLRLECALTEPSAFVRARVSWTLHPLKAWKDFTQSSMGISLLRQLEGCLSWFFCLPSQGIFPLSSSRWRGHSLLNQSWRTAHNGVQSQPQVTNCVAINEGFGARQNVWHSKFSALLPQKGNLWLLDPP